MHSSVLILDKLNSCAHSFSVWGRDLAVRFHKRITSCQAKMETLRFEDDGGSA